MHGLPQTGILENKLLAQRLSNHGYYQVKHTPVLGQHVWRYISFKMVVETFVIGCVGREHTDHLMSEMKMYDEKSQHIRKENYNAV